LPNAAARRRPRRILALVFPQIAVDLYRRRSATAPSAPFALHERSNNALRLAALDAAAAAAGLYCGQPLAEARALAPTLATAPLDRAADTADFAALMQALMRYSPLVAPSGDDAALIDIAGAAHLFGGEQAAARDAVRRLAARGLKVRAAIASAPAAARALAAFHSLPDETPIITPGGEARAVAPLPVEALGLDAAMAERLRSLGLKTVGAIAARGRGELARRFGEDFLARLDAIEGRRDTPIAPVAPAPDLFVAEAFAEPVETVDAALARAGVLAQKLSLQLEREGLGATRFVLDLFRLDMTRAQAAIAFARPSRDAAAIARLLRLKLEREGEAIDPGFGFEILRLSAEGAAPLGSAARDVFAARHGEAEEALADELTNRLGPGAVFRAEPRQRHEPERAAAPAPFSRAVSWAGAPRLPRPLLMFAAPEPIAVVALAPDGPPATFRWRRIAYRVARAAGPERILDDWRARAPRLRDYYRVEDESGRRYWIFRDSAYGEAPPKWFLHGLFS
jgi:protein ImuB